MGQEFFVKSDTLENKLRQLLPSQGGLGQGVDLSATTQIVPIVNLTESAEGSEVRADLQTAFSHTTLTTFSVTNTTTTVISNTGYYRIIGNFSAVTANPGAQGTISLDDGATNKVIVNYGQSSGYATNETIGEDFDFIVFLAAGINLKVGCTTISGRMIGSVRQIADIDGNLTNP